MVDEWLLQPDALRVKVRAYVPEGLRRGFASAEVTLINARGEALASERVEIELAQEQNEEELDQNTLLALRAGYRLLEEVAEFETKGLSDGDYLVRAKLNSMNKEREEVYAVRLRGEITVRDRERNEEVRKRISGKAIKFEFTQGFPINKAISFHLPFIRAIKEAGLSAYEFMPRSGGFWTEDEFGIFEHLLKTAQQENFDIWALLSPYPTAKALRESPDKGRSYYIKTVERFGELASKYRNFVGYTFDDFVYYMSYFTPDFVKEMTEAGRAEADSLLFTPLMYYPGLTRQFFREYGPYVDGVIFHYRAGSNPASYIEDYDPSSFQDYAECMRAELRRVRKVADSEPVICGIYIGYSRGGWGVHFREGRRRFTENGISKGKVPWRVFEAHTVIDALLKLSIAHEYTDAIRVYGLGIRHPAYRVMGTMIQYWQERNIPWGFRFESKK